MYTKQERHVIYKEILADFDRVQESHGNSHLSFQIDSYLLIREHKREHKYDETIFPEIFKHKPKDFFPLKYQGYWFKEMGKKEAIKIHRDILLQAIKETETNSKQMTKYKHKKTGTEVIIEDNYTNSNDIVPLIKSLYENSDEWMKMFPIDESNISDVSDEFVKKYCSNSGGATFTKDFQDGLKKGIQAYIRCGGKLEDFGKLF